MRPSPTGGPHVEASLAIRREVLEPDDPVITSSLNTLAALKSRQGDDRGAIPLLREAVQASLRKIQRRHWEGLAVRCELDPKPLVERVTELVAALPGAVERAAAAARDEGIDHEIVERLESEIRNHSEDCLRISEVSCELRDAAISAPSSRPTPKQFS